MHVLVLAGWAPSLVQFRGPLLAAMVARGHRVTAMAPDGTDQVRRDLQGLGVAFEEISMARAQVDALADARTLAALVGRMRSLRPDLVFTYTIKPVIYGNLAARLAGVPRRFSMLTGLGYAFLQQDRLARRLLRRTAAGLYRLALSGADGLFVQNLDDQRDLGAAGGLPTTTPTTLVRGSGVDLARFAQTPLPAPPLRFLFVGRLLREKGILDFVEMARRVRVANPEVRFVVVGWIDQNPGSVSRAEVEGWVDQGVIEYAGEVADVRPHLAASHVLVLPSYREGTPRSVLEALSSGRPVIVTDVPGCRDTIVDGVEGFVVPPRDPAALAAAAQRFLDDPQLVSRLADHARARAVSRYDADAIAREMVRVMGL